MKYNQEVLEALSDEEKLLVICKELQLETHNGTTKDDLLFLLRLMFDMFVDASEEESQNE